MEINWILLEIVAVLVVVFIVYVVKQNKKDKKNLTHKLNNDFKKREEAEFNDEI